MMEGPPKPTSALPMMMRVSQRLVERSFYNELRLLFRTWFEEDTSPKAALGIRYGKNFLLTPGDKRIMGLTREDLVEVADYDPVRNSLLYIGKQAPGRFSPFLWFVFRTFPDVNAVVIVPDKGGAKFDDVKALDMDMTYINSQSSLQVMPFFKENRAGRINTGETVFLLDDVRSAEDVLKGLNPA
jgi:hypothetical protein